MPRYRSARTYEITPAMLEEFAQRFEAPIMEEGFVAAPPV